MFRKVMGDPPIGQIAFTFSTLGFLNALLMWPVCVALYFTGTETMSTQRMPWIVLLLASILLLGKRWLKNPNWYYSTLLAFHVHVFFTVFHILMQFSSAVTYNMFVTLGLITAVPVSGGNKLNNSLLAQKYKFPIICFVTIFLPFFRCILQILWLIVFFFYLIALDVILYGATFAGMKLAGVILIGIGFFLVMFPENWPDYITRLLRYHHTVLSTF